MPNQPVDLARRLRQERRRRGLSQSAIAQRVRVSQSAISRFESGEPCLSDATVRLIADELGLDVEVAFAPTEPKEPRTSTIRFFCPGWQCASQFPWVQSDRCLFVPRQVLASPIDGPRCSDCGEVLEHLCSKCQRLVNEGACCAHCGEPYVAVPGNIATKELRRLANQQQENLRALRTHTAAREHLEPESGAE